jgi:hypothetical protein
VLQGLYKFRFTTERGEGCGVMFATAGGGLYGGDSGSSFVGGFTEADGVISVEVTMSRHYHDPKYVPMFDVDNVVMKFTGDHRGEEVHFEGGSAALPGVRFTTILTPINETDAPPPGVVGPDGIANGLYSIHIRMLDGIDAGNSGVMMLHDGRIRGGDAFFDYIGAYSSANGKWKGEIVNREHTPAKGERPVFGGHESASASPAPTMTTARKEKPPRSPASAASASRRCCGSWWGWRVKPSRSPAAVRR